MYSIRRAVAADADALADLRVAFLSEVVDAAGKPIGCALPDAREALSNYFRTHIPDETFIGWIAEADGRIIGTSGLVFLRKPPSFHNLSGVEGYIMNIYTLPDWRGRGVAGAMLERAIDYARAFGVKCISLHATQKGRPLYGKAGFAGAKDEMELRFP